MNRSLDFLLFITLVAISLGSHLSLAHTELMSPDASGYLDMGRNIWSGGGAVSSYNIYQFWQGPTHPALPYMQPLYPLVCGLVWNLFNLKAVIALNVVLFGINCGLLYLILRAQAGQAVCFLIALVMVFSATLVFTAIWPWTEQLHLLFLFVSILLYLRVEKGYFWVGVLLALSCLVRVAGLYNVFAFAMTVLIMKGFSSNSRAGTIKLGLGFLAAFLSYELFCLVKHGVFYPEYLSAAKTYRLSEIVPGAFFQDGLPVLHVPAFNFSLHTRLANVGNHLTEFFMAFGHLKFIFVFIPAVIVMKIFKKQSPMWTMLTLQGCAVILCYALSLSWLPQIETTRYVLIPFMMLVSTGLLLCYEFLTRLCAGKGKRLGLTVFTVLILGILFFGVRDYLSFRNYYKNGYPRQYAVYIEARNDIYAWIREYTKKDVLIASNLLADAFLYERPFVSLPSGKTLTAENITQFMDIYKPDYVLTTHTELVHFLTEGVFVEERARDRLVLLRRA